MINDKEIIDQQKSIIMKQNAIIAGMSKSLHMVALMLPSMIPEPQHQEHVKKMVDGLETMANLKDSV